MYPHELSRRALPIVDCHDIGVAPSNLSCLRNAALMSLQVALTEIPRTSYKDELNMGTWIGLGSVLSRERCGRKCRAGRRIA